MKVHGNQLAVLSSSNIVQMFSPGEVRHEVRSSVNFNSKYIGFQM